MYCRKCGAQLRQEDIFCSKCGACVAPTDDVSNALPNDADSVLDLSQVNKETLPKKGKNKKLIITLSIAACAVLIAAAAVLAVTLNGSAGDRYYAQGKYEKAADEYEDMLEKDAENTEVRIKLAKALIKLGEYDDAIEALDYVFKYEDGNAEVYELLLTACANEHEDALANEYYSKALQDNTSVNLSDTGYAQVVDLIDLSLKSAEKIRDVDVIERDRVDSEAEPDTIIKQSPEAGSIGRVTAGSLKIYVTVSDGPGETIMKEYQGEAFSKVKADLGDDYTVEKEEEGSSAVEKGKVVRTEPAAGEPLKKGDIVTVYISSGAKVVSVPKLTGKTLQQAEASLGNVGLTLGSVTEESSSKAEGTVIRQTPSYKSKVSDDTLVDIVVSSGAAE